MNLYESISNKLNESGKTEELKESFKEVLKQGKRGSEPVALVYWEGSYQPYVLAIGFNEEEHNWDYGYYFSDKETAERAFDFVCKGGNMHHFDEADEETQDINVAQANQVFAKLANETEKAFSEFGGKFEFGKPDGNVPKDIHGNDYIRGFNYQFYINSTIYRFQCECFHFDKFSVAIDFGPNGYRSGNYGTFSVADGEKVLKAAKIAETLIPRFEHEISKLNIGIRKRTADSGDDSEIR